MRLFLFLVVLLFTPLAGFAQSANHARAGTVSFVTGKVQAADASAVRALKVGDAVYEGDRLTTGAGGHLHIKTVDDGFLALRPDTQARVDVYSYDAAAPQATRIRLVLESGVMRTVSGTGARAARDKFRLNTPVAAIGIRGTDFTVSTTATLTRAVVQMGAIVVSAFDAQCRPESLGPCSGSAVRALSGDQVGKLLELRRGQMVPSLIDIRPNTGAPDQVAPPSSSEPHASSSGDRGQGSSAAPPSALVQPASAQPQVVPQIGQQATALAVESRISGQLTAAGDAAAKAAADKAAADAAAAAAQAAAAQAAAQAAADAAAAQAAAAAAQAAADAAAAAANAVPQPAVTWGRWAAVAGLPPDSGITAFIAQNGPIAAINALYVLSINNSQNLQLPSGGAYSFRLDNAQAWVTNAGMVLGAATVQNGQLSVNFGTQRFATSLNVDAMGYAAALRANGILSSDGKLQGLPFLADGTTNMIVNGGLGGTTGTRAAYLFDTVLGNGRGVTGATNWSR